MRKKQKLLPSISEVLFLVILIRIASVFGKYLRVFWKCSTSHSHNEHYLSWCPCALSFFVFHAHCTYTEMMWVRLSGIGNGIVCICVLLRLLLLLSNASQFMWLHLFCVNWYLGQTTCNNGQGRVLYERLPNQQLQGFDDDVVRDTAPPFRVLEKCQDLCLRDRTASNNLVRACTSFDFQPGSRIASYSGSAEYEESTCYLTREQPAPEGIGILMLVPNSVHFTEICLACRCFFTFSHSKLSELWIIAQIRAFLLIIYS